MYKQKYYDPYKCIFDFNFKRVKINYKCVKLILTY